MDHSLTLRIPTPMYIILICTAVFFIYNMYKNNISLYIAGKEDKSRFNNIFKRVKLVLEEIFLLKRMRGNKYATIFHVFILYSFILLVGTKFIEAISANTPINAEVGIIGKIIPPIQFIAGFFMLSGFVIMLIRRFILKPAYLENTGNKFDILFFGYVGMMVFISILLSGMKIYYEGHGEFVWYSPFGYLASFMFSSIPKSNIQSIFQALWITEIFVMSVGLMFVYTYSRLKHAFLIPANIFFSSLKPKGSLSRFDIEEKFEQMGDDEEFEIGNATTSDFTWKQRLDLDACIECGRCESLCPSYNTNQILSPKKVIRSLREAVREKDSNGKELIGSAITENDIWLCRTCRACEENCPAYIEHIDLFMELRRAEVAMKGALPADAARALKDLQMRGNPFGPQDDRVQWMISENMPIVREGDEVDVLLWIGCCCAFDSTKHQVIQDLRRILETVNMSYGVLGGDEKCCGDPARVLGDEATFQMIVKEQIELINSRKFNKMLVICPHCYNNFKNEYPQFGANFDVEHHTTFIYNLLRDKKINLVNEIDAKVSYHDPCYLGRYNDIYDEPRKVLSSIDGLKITEFKNSKQKSYCCGGGGGHFWMDLDMEIGSKSRINIERVNEAYDHNVDTIATACIFCKQMLEDAVKMNDLDNNLSVVDIATLVVTAMGKEEDEKIMPMPLPEIKKVS
ncbi:MAG: (Fe-S)-binding protein [Spirochaetota bacterium]|nr:(Fe-S)-binding protein [Spirochaetota bacterium]